MSEREKIVILGAGISGLAAGYFLSRTGRYDVTILEKEPVTGGLCASFRHGDFTLDYGPHKIYSVIPGILDEICAIMGDRLLKVRKKNRIFLRSRLVDYPVRMGNLARVLGPAVFLQMGLGYAAQVFRGLLPRHPPRSYEEYIVHRFGSPAYRLVFEPLADKVWGEPSGLHPDMARTRLPASGGREIILKLLKLKRESAETSAEFFYYPRKGFGDFPQALNEKIGERGGRTVVNAHITGLRSDRGKIVSVEAAVNGTGVRYPCDYLVSTVPLQILGKMVFRDSDAGFNRAVADLQFRHLIIVYLFINRPAVLEDQWLFFPERSSVFSRISEQKLMSPDVAPPERSALCCDLTCAEDSPVWRMTDGEIAGECIRGLEDAGFIRKSEVDGTLVVRRRHFYPRYDLGYEEKMRTVTRKLQQVENLLLSGRIGMYNYNNSDHCIDMGRFIADNLVRGESPATIWNELENRVRNYKIVD